jgi:membrane fusion protein, heavy metal efflux system
MNMKKTRFLISAFSIASLLVLSLGGCNSVDRKSAEKMTSFGSATSGAEAELFTVPQEQMSHVQIVAIAPGPLTRTLRLSGQVTYNAFNTTPVITPIGGPVSTMLAYPGQYMRTGETMLTIASPDYSQLRASYLKARDAFTVADKNYKRAQDLFSHQAIAEQDLLQAESNRTQAQADMTAAAQSLQILGIHDPDSLATAPATANIPLLAPVAGTVVEADCGVGQLLQAGTTQCYVISDLSTVWVLVNVYQNQLAYVHVGDSVTVESDAYPSAFRGRISYVASALDPNTRTLQARIVTSNPGEKLKNQMYVTAIVTAGTVPNAITVPVDSVLRNSENQPFVYVQKEANQFERRMVEIGETQNGRTEILSGLSPGEHVVADGSLFLQFQNSLQR